MFNTHNKGNTLVTIVIILALVLIGFFIFRGDSSGDVPEEGDRMEQDTAMTDETHEDDSMMEGDASHGAYEAYAPEKVAAAAENGDAVLFFHATWCPTCRALDADIEENMGDIPADVTILKTDYDTEDELKRQYGVTTQHTLVQVDANGKLIKKWSGSPNLANVLAQIQ